MLLITLTMKYLLCFLCAPALAFLTLPGFAVTEIDCAERIQPEIFHSPNLFFRCKGSNHSIFHLSRLTDHKIKPYVAGDLRVFPGHEPWEYVREKSARQKSWSPQWIELEPNAYTEVTENVPVTLCLVLQQEKGAIFGSIQKQYGASTDVDFSFGLTDSIAAEVSALGGATLSLGADYLCSANPGQTVQLISSPTFYVFAEARYRVLEVTRAGVQYGDWKDVPLTKVHSSVPLLRCVTDPRELQCGLLMHAHLGDFGD